MSERPCARVPGRDPTVVFVLSTNYAGSHLLAQLLGSHPACSSIGELHNFHKLRDRGRPDRNVVNDYANNPLFAGLPGRPPRDWHALILANASRLRPGTTTLIDVSKRVRWAARFLDATHLTPAFVHLVRDPRALVRRWLLTRVALRDRLAERRRLARRRPTWLLNALFAPIETVFALKWVAANEKIARFLEGRGNASLVTYEELAREPRTTLQRLMPELGLDFEESQLEYGRVAHAGTLKRDYLGASARSRIAADDRWREELSPAVQKRVQAMRPVRALLERLDLTLTATGLQRRD